MSLSVSYWSGKETNTKGFGISTPKVAFRGEFAQQTCNPCPLLVQDFPLCRYSGQLRVENPTRPEELVTPPSAAPRAA
jgi:hypothetical protein